MNKLIILFYCFSLFGCESKTQTIESRQEVGRVRIELFKECIKISLPDNNSYVDNNNNLGDLVYRCSRESDYLTKYMIEYK